jgi:hypothetical protein
MKEAGVQRERRRCGERGGDSTTSRHERDVGATNEAMQQPASTREARRGGWYGKGWHGKGGQDDGKGWYDDGEGRHGKGRHSEGRHDNGTGRHCVGRHDERRHDSVLFKLRAFVDATLLPVPPSVLLSCWPFILSQHSDSASRTSRALASRSSRCRLSNATPLSKMRAPCDNDGVTKTPGQP